MQYKPNQAMEANLRYLTSALNYLNVNYGDIYTRRKRKSYS